MEAREIVRPNGKVYRPRAELRAQLIGPEDDDPTSVVILGTHDFHAALGVAERALEEYLDEVFGSGKRDYRMTVDEPRTVWVRSVPMGSFKDDGRMRFVDDPEHGRAGVEYRVLWEYEE